MRIRETGRAQAGDAAPPGNAQIAPAGSGPAARRRFEDRFQALARHTFDAAFECRVDHDSAPLYQALNDAVQRVVGPGGGVPLVHPDDRAVVQAHMQRVLGGSPGVCVFRVITPAGTLRWFGTLTRPVCDDDGWPRAYVYGLVHDFSTHSQVSPARLEGPSHTGQPGRWFTASCLR